MIVVSNSSPLIAFALIDQLGLLPALFTQIHIATATRVEVIGKGKGRAGAAALAKARWLVTDSVSRRALSVVRDHPGSLHAGEVETIALALHLRADLALIDERAARTFAERMEVPILGTLGVLKLAHQRGMLADLRATLDVLRAKGFRFSDTLYQQVLAE